MATTQPSNQLQVSGPYGKENLTVFLIHGPDRLRAARYLTFQEAIDQKKLIVHETGTVSELEIENVSDEDIYIQSGDIVKGGKQDRTIATDFIASAQGGKVPIAAFCVEHGRWSRRGGESAFQFSGGSAMVAGASMKRASNVLISGSSQQRVWDEASSNTAKLSRNLKRSVADPVSASSFQLALENVEGDADALCKSLIDAVHGTDDVIGWAYAINGKVAGANIYGSHDLFLKLWPKLLRSGAVEAIAENPADAKQPAATATAEDVRVFLAAAEQAPPKPTPVNARTSCNVYDAKESILLQTEDRHTNEWIHRGYLPK